MKLADFIPLLIALLIGGVLAWVLKPASKPELVERPIAEIRVDPAYPAPDDTLPAPVVVPERQLSSNAHTFGIQVTPNWYTAGTVWGLQVDSVRIDTLRFTGRAELWSVGDSLQFRNVQPLGGWIIASPAIESRATKKAHPLTLIIAGGYGLNHEPLMILGLEKWGIGVGVYATNETAGVMGMVGLKLRR